MAFDVPIAGDAYPLPSDGWTYLNAGQCIQVPERVQAATISTFHNAQESLPGEIGVGAHGQSCSSGVPAAAELTASARRASTGLTGGPVAGVVLGSSREVLMKQLTSAMSRYLTLGSNLMVSCIDSQIIHAPLRRATNLYGVQVRITEADLPSDTLPSWWLDELMGEHVRLVAVPTADPFVGITTPVTDISRRVHEHSNIWVLVDASGIVAYLDVPMSKLGTDIMLVGASVLGGPEVATLVFRDPGMLERMASLNYMPSACGVERIGASPVSPALFDGVSESMLYLASLDSTARGSHRHHIETTMPQVSHYLTMLSERLIAALMTLPRVYITGMDTEDDSSASVSRAQHIPRVSFLVDGVSAKVVVDGLLDNGLVTSIVNAYESPLLEATGIGEAGGAVRAGLQPFSTLHDIDQLVRTVALLGQPSSRLTRRSAQSHRRPRRHRAARGPWLHRAYP